MKSPRHLLSLGAAVLFAGVLAGCASIGAPVPPSLELPKPPTDLRAVRKGDRVYLSWTVPTQTIDRQNVRHLGRTDICRSLEAAMSECGKPVASLPPETVASPSQPGGNPGRQENYTDTLPEDLEQQNPTRTITYAVEVLNGSGRGAGLSKQVRVALAPSLPPPGNFKAQVQADGVALTWDCGAPRKARPEISYRYRIYRRSLESGTDLKLGDFDCSGGRFEDHTFEWQKAYEYRISVVTLAGGENAVVVEGEDSPIQKVFTNDRYPPGVPTGLEAVFSGPGQPPFVDLVWSPGTDADLAGYNLYRREDTGQVSKINAELVKTPAYRDQNVVAGKTYWYSVSSVDLRGNESARSEETSEHVVQNP